MKKRSFGSALVDGIEISSEHGGPSAAWKPLRGGLAFSHLKGPLWQQKRLALLWHRLATGEKLAEDDLFELDERNIILFGAHA